MLELQQPAFNHKGTSMRAKSYCTGVGGTDGQKEPGSMMNNIKTPPWASLVARWLGVRLPMPGTRVRALVREDPTCRGATRPVSHNYWSPCSATRQATAMRGPCTATKSGPRLLQLERAHVQQWRPKNAAKKIKEQQKQPLTSRLLLK